MFYVPLRMSLGFVLTQIFMFWSDEIIFLTVALTCRWQRRCWIWGHGQQANCPVPWQPPAFCWQPPTWHWWDWAQGVLHEYVCKKQLVVNSSSLCCFVFVFFIKRWWINVFVLACSVWKCRGTADQHQGRWRKVAQLWICGLWWVWTRAKNPGGQGRRGMYQHFITHFHSYGGGLVTHISTVNLALNLTLINF